jgi:hypothetical protein
MISIFVCGQGTWFECQQCHQLIQLKYFMVFLFRQILGQLKIGYDHFCP